MEDRYTGPDDFDVPGIDTESTDPGSRSTEGPLRIGTESVKPTWLDRPHPAVPRFGWPE